MRKANKNVSCRICLHYVNKVVIKLFSLLSSSLMYHYICLL